ncbi:MAG: lytic murein transglycosylase [Rubrimonas sp.]|uniref:lytic murein transglycosylase n=1 Tax=Rubrimonas sp. TaxID=2036015 RepID=UPI002FDDF218
MTLRTAARLATAAVLLAGCAQSEPAARAPAPQARPATPVAADPAEPAPRPASFVAWRDGFRAKARAAGVSDATFDAAFAGVGLNARVLELDGRQPEFVRPIWDYIDSAVSETRVATGRRLRVEKADDLARIEAAYGVPAEIVLAIWGAESAFGSFYGDINVIEALATLAYEGRRRSFGEEQLIAALTILQAGDIAPERMVGSWAGAMGHTQFIPTSYLAYAVDFTGDGRRDLWAEDALDALASTANYLARAGWRTGAPWGAEARLPQGFDHGLADGRARDAAFWAERGVRTVGGAAPVDHGPAKLLLPAGARGPAFLTYANFDAIKRYNNATAYALAVAHLADRIGGGGPFAAEWPRGDRPLSRSEKEEMQRRLTGLGFDTRGADGIVGPDTRAAIRGFQSSRGLPPDGYDSAELLAELRRAGGL